MMRFTPILSALLLVALVARSDAKDGDGTCGYILADLNATPPRLDNIVNEVSGGPGGLIWLLLHLERCGIV
jgi:hypothetical protein